VLYIQCSIIGILLNRLDWISQKSLCYESKGFLVQAGSHEFLHISGMLIQLLALPWLYNETLTFKRVNQNGRLVFYISPITFIAENIHTSLSTKDIF